MGCWLAKKKNKKNKTLVSVFVLLMHQHFDFRVCTGEIFLFSFFFPIFFFIIFCCFPGSNSSFSSFYALSK